MNRGDCVQSNAVLRRAPKALYNSLGFVRSCIDCLSSTQMCQIDKAAFDFVNENGQRPRPVIAEDFSPFKVTRGLTPLAVKSKGQLPSYCHWSSSSSTSRSLKMV